MGWCERKMIAFVGVFLVLFPVATLGDAFAPSMPPFFEKICDKVECGRGRCRADTNGPFRFTCECDAGWKRAMDNTNHTFLPCIIPDCNMNTTCVPAPSPALAPAPAKRFPGFGSSFDPCDWTYCGGGTCKKTGDFFKHTCECNNGYTNLLNKTYFPCFGQCDLGSNCSRIISSASADNSSPGSGNHATSSLPGKLQIMVLIVTSIAMILVK